MKGEHITLLSVQIIQRVNKRATLSFLFCMTISRGTSQELSIKRSFNVSGRPVRIIIIRFPESQYRSDMQMESDLIKNKSTRRATSTFMVHEPRV